MAKKQSASSARGKRAAKSVRHIPDSKIDFSDAPDSTDAELRRAKRVGRPPTGRAKQLIALRIDPKLLVALRKLAIQRSKPYQTLIHEILEKALKRVA
jgi:predicted DNA binding CopG/RHH family protein